MSIEQIIFYIGLTLVAFAALVAFVSLGLWPHLRTWLIKSHINDRNRKLETLLLFAGQYGINRPHYVWILHEIGQMTVPGFADNYKRAFGEPYPRGEKPTVLMGSIELEDLLESELIILESHREPDAGA